MSRRRRLRCPPRRYGSGAAGSTLCLALRFAQWTDGSRGLTRAVALGRCSWWCPRTKPSTGLVPVVSPSRILNDSFFSRRTEIYAAAQRCLDSVLRKAAGTGTVALWRVMRRSLRQARAEGNVESLCPRPSSRSDNRCIPHWGRMGATVGYHGKIRRNPVTSFPLSFAHPDDFLWCSSASTGLLRCIRRIRPGHWRSEPRPSVISRRRAACGEANITCKLYV